VSIVLGSKEVVIGAKNLRCCITKKKTCNQALPFTKMYHYSENTIKGAKGAKVKEFFPRIAHDMCQFCVSL
jgi:hypothetical protein